MSLIKPFLGLRPAPGRAAEVAAPPYDVPTIEEARQQVESRPWSFLHVSRAEVDLPEGVTAEYNYDICDRLDGFPRHLGIHSGGMVFSQQPLWEEVPMEWGLNEERSLLQWDEDDCASMGVVKIE